MPASRDSRLAVVVAVVLAIAGVGLIASGVALVVGGEGPAAPTTVAAPATSIPVSSATTTLPLVTTVPATAREFVALVDDTGTLAFEAPADWTDVETGAWTSDGVDIGPSLSAAVDLAAWIEGWETPGLFVGVTDQLGAAAAMGDFGGACEVDRAEVIAVAGDPGTAQWWWSCGASGTSFYVAVVVRSDGSIILFQILDRPEALPGVVSRVLETFRYEG